LCVGRTLVVDLLVGLLLLLDRLRDLDVLLGDAVGATLRIVSRATMQSDGMSYTYADLAIVLVVS
jgi:hypothetical protein